MASGHGTVSFMPYLLLSISNAIQGAQNDRVSMMGNFQGQGHGCALLNKSKKMRRIQDLLLAIRPCTVRGSYMTSGLGLKRTGMAREGTYYPQKVVQDTKPKS